MLIVKKISVKLQQTHFKVYFCRINKSVCNTKFSFSFRQSGNHGLPDKFNTTMFTDLVNCSAYVKTRAQLFNRRKTNPSQQMYGHNNTINLQVMIAICINEMMYKYACTARV